MIDAQKKDSLPQARKAVWFCLVLQCLNFIYLVGVRIDDVNPAGNTGIKRMHRSQYLQRFFGIGNRCSDKGFFHRPQFVVGIPRSQVPGRRHHILIILDLFVFDLDPVAQRTPGNVVETDAHGAVRHLVGLIGFGIAALDICHQLVDPGLNALADGQGFNPPGGGAAQGRK